MKCAYVMCICDVNSFCAFYAMYLQLVWGHDEMHDSATQANVVVANYLQMGGTKVDMFAAEQTKLTILRCRILDY